MTTRAISTVKSEKHFHIQIKQIKNNFIHQYQINESWIMDHGIDILIANYSVLGASYSSREVQ